MYFIPVGRLQALSTHKDAYIWFTNNAPFGMAKILEYLIDEMTNPDYTSPEIFFWEDKDMEAYAKTKQMEEEH